jgi:hypothetical protein
MKAPLSSESPSYNDIFIPRADNSQMRSIILYSTIGSCIMHGKWEHERCDVQVTATTKWPPSECVENIIIKKDEKDAFNFHLIFFNYRMKLHLCVKLLYFCVWGKKLSTKRGEREKCISFCKELDIFCFM